MRCLITGSNGFVGPHLVRALRDKGHECVGLALHDSGRAGCPVHTADLTDVTATEAVLRTVRPDWVFHLAGYASPREAKDHPAAAWAGNVTATLGLYQAVHQAGDRPRILYVSTGMVYGAPAPGDGAFTEDSPLRPNDPYTASKAAADVLSRYQSACLGLDVVCARPLNHIGPAQSEKYAVSRFAQQVVEAERNQRRTIKPGGNLDAYRDLTDVRDTVGAYLLLIEKGRAGEAYNVASGRDYQMRDVLKKLMALAGVSVPIEEPVDASRTPDAAVNRVDTRKLREATGWEAEFSLDQTLADVLADWRSR
jgi:GDP-4-dehydro-6-deoxy-D-mannose reductase